MIHHAVFFKLWAEKFLGVRGLGMIGMGGWVDGFMMRAGVFLIFFFSTLFLLRRGMDGWVDGLGR